MGGWWSCLGPFAPVPQPNDEPRTIYRAEMPLVAVKRQLLDLNWDTGTMYYLLRRENWKKLPKTNCISVVAGRFEKYTDLGGTDDDVGAIIIAARVNTAWQNTPLDCGLLDYKDYEVETRLVPWGVLESEVIPEVDLKDTLRTRLVPLLEVPLLEEDTVSFIPRGTLDTLRKTPVLAFRGDYCDVSEIGSSLASVW